jgi:hypothetical protein
MNFFDATPQSFQGTSHGTSCPKTAWYSRTFDGPIIPLASRLMLIVGHLLEYVSDGIQLKGNHLSFNLSLPLVFAEIHPGLTNNPLCSQ